MQELKNEECWRLEVFSGKERGLEVRTFRTKGGRD